jgi:hypothetical protein
MDVAEAAFYAFLRIDAELQNIPPGDKPQKSPQRTEITAPESLSFKVEEKEGNEYCSDEETLEKGGVDSHPLQELNQGITEASEFERVKKADKGIKSIMESGENAFHKGTIEKR